MLVCNFDAPLCQFGQLDQGMYIDPTLVIAERHKPRLRPLLSVSCLALHCNLSLLDDCVLALLGSLGLGKIMPNHIWHEESPNHDCEKYIESASPSFFGCGQLCCRLAKAAKPSLLGRGPLSCRLAKIGTKDITKTRSIQIAMGTR